MASGTVTRELLECAGRYFARHDWAGVRKHARFLFTCSESHLHGERLEVCVVAVEYPGEDPLVAMLNRNFRVVRKARDRKGITKEEVAK